MLMEQGEHLMIKRVLILISLLLALTMCGCISNENNSPSAENKIMENESESTRIVNETSVILAGSESHLNGSIAVKNESNATE